MKDEKLLMMILDSWDKPMVFADTVHIIRYMNLPARKHYAKWGDVLGKRIFECHNEKSCDTIRDVFKRLSNGETEALISDSPKRRVFMRAVRGENNELIGYYERYEPPSK
ncbi:MAG: hypothetical protein A2Z02_06175 [Chloroflexi bacterium RBG_16_48_7]|nr:MAG: hypothetical protein A2Z02_06175 [Chloroflexi bacterium RBG_16_48_7]